MRERERERENDANGSGGGGFPDDVIAMIDDRADGSLRTRSMANMTERRFSSRNLPGPANRSRRIRQDGSRKCHAKRCIALRIETSFDSSFRGREPTHVCSEF